MYPYQRFVCKDPERREPLSDHVEVVIDLFTNWPELRADPLCQATPTPAKPVSQATTPTAVLAATRVRSSFSWNRQRPLALPEEPPTPLTPPNGGGELHEHDELGAETAPNAPPLAV